MTREEAIGKWIYPAIATTWNEKKCNEILKALEQEPCEDCISRKNTLEAMIKQLGIKNEDYLIPAEATLYKVVKNMPPVNPQEPKWIPVDYDRYPETYPKAFQEVWLTDGEGEVKHKAYDGTRNIKAWMPYIKPEPYKAESEE